MKSRLLGVSFDAPASPNMTLKSWKRSENLRAGWGFGWYPADDGAAMVVKDPTATADTPLTRVLRNWERFRSSVFLCHTRGAAKIASQPDTHPFQRTYAARDWLFAHTGDLSSDIRSRLALPEDTAFEPIGRTDSEHVFCWLLNRIRQEGARDLASVGYERLASWLRDIGEMGGFNILLTDGHDLIAYRDQQSDRPMHHTRITPPHDDVYFENDVLKLDLDNPTDVNRTVCVIATQPLSNAGWVLLQPGEMLVARRGVFVWSNSEQNLGIRPIRNATESVRPNPIIGTDAPNSGPSEVAIAQAQRAAAVPSDSTMPAPNLAPNDSTRLSETHPRSAARGLRDHRPQLDWREMLVTHETSYRYDEAVERSSHIVRLQPVHDLYQDLVDYQLEISPPGAARRFQDVFGNQMLSFKIERPYSELWIRATSRLRVRSRKSLSSVTRRATIPLVWMPWQRQMMTPYLLPPELPETQLRSLSQYAMSFVERQDFDLIETLRDINQTIYRDFEYIPGSTNLETSAFEVFITRRGVCQDFANLFICMARLLGIPARYRVGYIHTGTDYENQIQSDASHAWVELYLPRIGWRGFDPTNGVLANLDHIRVATGRNFRDATPTSGTIFRGGLGERLRVSVRVEPLEDEAKPSP